MGNATFPRPNLRQLVTKLYPTPNNVGKFLCEQNYLDPLDNCFHGQADTRMKIQPRER